MEKVVGLSLYFACVGFIGLFALLLNKNVHTTKWAKIVTWIILWASLFAMLFTQAIIWGKVSDL